MKLLIVDDDQLIRKSLEISLSREADITIIGSAKDGTEAVEICQTTTPDIILMDIHMPGTDGIAATRLIKKQNPTVKIMMLTTFDDRANIQQALAAGADGYLIKTDKISSIAGKLRILLDGIGVLDAEALKKIAPVANPALETLTPREQDIARLVAQGLPNKDIATQLYLSEGTVRNNIVVIMEKLNVSNRTQLGMAYYSHNT
ncbi:MAG: response regulator transcription factor [Defluviitaleaceae bacterium]|nr:response regulator transcription factor [Defluviitaleaceae bacterium]